MKIVYRKIFIGQNIIYPKGGVGAVVCFTDSLSFFAIRIVQLFRKFLIGIRCRSVVEVAADDFPVWRTADVFDEDLHFFAVFFHRFGQLAVKPFAFFVVKLLLRNNFFVSRPVFLIEVERRKMYIVNSHRIFPNFQIGIDKPVSRQILIRMIFERISLVYDGILGQNGIRINKMLTVFQAEMMFECVFFLQNIQCIQFFLLVVACKFLKTDDIRHIFFDKFHKLLNMIFINIRLSVAKQVGVETHNANGIGGWFFDRSLVILNVKRNIIDADKNGNYGYKDIFLQEKSPKKHETHIYDKKKRIKQTQKRKQGNLSRTDNSGQIGKQKKKCKKKVCKEKNLFNK